MRRIRPSLWVLAFALIAVQACAEIPERVESPLVQVPPPAVPGVRAAIVTNVDRSAIEKSFDFQSNRFEVGEGRRVYAIMELTRLVPNREYIAKTYWHSPDGRVLGPTVERFTPNQSNWYVWFWLELAPRFNRASGFWRVRLELDDRLLATRSFNLGGGLVAAGGTETARVETVAHVDPNRVGDALQNITDQFEVGEGKRVYVLMDLNQLTPNRPYTARAFWHSPDGSTVGPTVSRFTPNQSNWYVWFWLDLAPRFNRAPGSWRVRVELDGRTMSTRTFNLTSGAPMVTARVETVANVDRERVAEGFQNITDRFEVAEGKRAYVLMELNQLIPNRPYTARVFWHSPDGSTVGPITESLNPNQSNWYVWFWLDLSPRQNRAPGSWRVRVELDGRTLATKTFNVEAPGGGVIVKLVTAAQVDRERIGDAFNNPSTSFQVGEGSRVYVVLDLERLTPQQNYVAKAYWHSPDGTMVGPTLSRFAPTQPGWYVWFWLDLAPRFNRAAGSWRVRLEIDDRPVGERLFNLAAPAGPPPDFPPPGPALPPPPTERPEEFPRE